jgi:hypothetical protein
MAKKFDTSSLKKDLEKKKAPGVENATSGLLKDVFDENKISILDEFKELIPKLSDEEFQLLEENILEEGCRDAIVLWQEGDQHYIIDGHNRYRICRQHGISFKTTHLTFEDRQDVIDWMVRNQLGKRNITEETKSYLRGLQYRREKNRRGGNKRFNSAADQESTSKRLAEEHKVSDKTIKRDEQFANAIDTIARFAGVDVKNKILNREIGSTKQQIQAIATLEPEQQETLLSRLKTGEISSLGRLLKADQQAAQEGEKPRPKVRQSTVKHKARVTDAAALDKIIAAFNQKQKAGAVKLKNECQIESVLTEDQRKVELTIEATAEDLFKIGLALSPYLG